MLERLHIQNYRVFNDLKIDRLSRLNLIAGKNNSGKTSLLETIFLLAGGGNPKAALPFSRNGIRTRFSDGRDPVETDVLQTGRGQSH